MIQITDNTQCCGCAACVQRCPKQCITLQEDVEGFLYPQVREADCIDCGLCEQVCPVLHPGKPRKPEACYAAYHPDEDIRRQSSSGGVFTALATKILSEGGVVFGVRFNEQWEVIHDYTETVEGLAAFRGSKYVQSRMGDNYRRAEAFLKAGRPVLFTGTPCQIAGLRRYLRKDYPQLFTMDFICHGVPSPMVWRRYLQEMQAKYPSLELREVFFRDKVIGWHQFSLTLRYAAAEHPETVFVETHPFVQNPYMLGFLKDIYLRPSCYACAVKSGKSGADITIGDFWGIEKVMPDFDDDRGVSCVLIQTEHGQQAWEQLALAARTVAYPEILKENSPLERSPKVSKKVRNQFYGQVSLKGVILTCEELTYVSVWKYFLMRTRLILSRLYHRVSPIRNELRKK